MFSSTGTRSDSGIGRPWLHTFRPTQCLLVLSRAIEIDAERPLRRQALDHADVGDRHRRRIGLAIAGRERLAVALEQRARPGPARAPRASASASASRPGADDRARRLSSSVARSGFGRLAAVAADDEVHAHQRPFREERIEGADAALERLGEIVADRARAPACRSARAARRPAPRRSGRSGRGRASTRTRGRSSSCRIASANAIERVLVDLEQLVARIGLQHVDQRLAGMAVRIEAGARAAPRRPCGADTGSRGPSAYRRSR